MPLRVLSILALFLIPLYALAGAGGLTPMTKANQPDFIEIEARRFDANSLDIRINVSSHGDYRPAGANVLVKEGERIRFGAPLALVEDTKTKRWVVTLLADKDFIRDSEIRLAFNNVTNPEAVETWSIPLAKFVTEK